MKIAIVGGEEDKWSPKRKEIAQRWILKILNEAKNGHLFLVPSMDPMTWSFKQLGPQDSPILVSGRCPKGGVDIWAEEVADKLGILKEIRLPEVNQWLDKVVFGARNRIGYRSRNVEIAIASKILYDIEPAKSCWRCGGSGFFEGKDIGQEKDCSFCEGDGAYGGGTWTLKYAKRLGKETFKIIITESMITGS